MNKRSVFFLLTSFLVLSLFFGCKKKGCTDPNASNYDVEYNSDDGSCIFPVLGCNDEAAINFDPDAEMSDGSCILLAQSNIDGANQVFMAQVTGQTDSNAVAHNGGISSSPDSTYRTSYINNLDGIISVGTVICKRVYKRNPDDTPGDLQMTFAMVKHYEGYNPDGGDWEYILMPMDTLVNYSTHPNGVIPVAEDDQVRGKISTCASCHALAGGGDFIFMN